MKIGIAFSRTQDVKAHSRWGDGSFEKIKSHGYSAIDYNLASDTNLIYTAPQAEVDEFLKKEKLLIEKAGLEISQTHGPWRWPPRDEDAEARKDWLIRMKKAARATAALGCKYLVIHAVMPFGIHEKGTPESEQTWQINLAFMRDLLRTAKEYGVTVCLENMPMPKFTIGSPEEVLRFVKEINDENLQICLDTGHVSVYSDLSLKEEVKRLGDYIKVLHVHDNDFGIDAHMFPTFGIINWAEFADALKEINYDGVFSLETCPPAQLSDGVFEELSTCLANIAKEITKDL